MAPKELPFNLRFNFELVSLAVLKNLDYFYFYRNKYWYSEKYVFYLKQILDNMKWYESRMQRLSENVHRFDVNETVQGNGFRSFEIIFERFFLEMYNFLKELSTSREKVLFLASTYLEYLRSYVTILENMKSCITYLLTVMDENTNGHPMDLSNHITVKELIEKYLFPDQREFYGRLQGFYFCSSMRKTLWGVSVIMASFSDLYQNSGGPLSRALFAVLHGIKYCLYPDLRCQQIVNVAQNASIEFLKAFWSLSETHFMKELPKWICPKMKVLEVLWIPNEPITMKIENSTKTVVIPVPSSHIPSAPIRCLLLSYEHRKGQYSPYKTATSPLSPSLLLHCHGGGFVSQTPECHEIYLRHWAKDLNIPILSVDYSLAPAAPFPRALEEVLLVYAWALENCHKLGWTGEKICFAGDSAGGNILMGIVIKTISLKIRKPDAILCAYTPLMLDIVPSPSRLLCWVDPLLPLGFMCSCLDSYVGAMQTDNAEYMETNKEMIPRARKLSSISEIIDSSFVFLQDNDWTEVNPNEPEARSNGNENIQHQSGLYSREPSEELSAEPYFPTSSSKLTEYLNQYLEYPSHEHSACNGEDDDEHMLYDFPRDIAFGLKQKCASLLFSVVGKAINFVEENSIFSTFLSSFVYTNKKTGIMSSTVNSENQDSPLLKKLKKLKVVVSNPYISPLFVSDEVLKEMPQIYFIALNFDPCLDDMITFAKRMSSVGKPVAVDMVDGVPHGFLNFLPFSREAHRGSDLCVKRIKEALGIQEQSC